MDERKILIRAKLSSGVSSTCRYTLEFKIMNLCVGKLKRDP